MEISIWGAQAHESLQKNRNVFGWTSNGGRENGESSADSYGNGGVWC